MLSGRVWVCDIADGRCWELPTAGSAIDPRLDPTGRRIAYAAGGSLRVVDLDGAGDRALAEPDAPTVVWGQAEFVAAEEMDRYRGFWWAPDGESLLVERYDESPVRIWYVADAANPEREPAAQRYPAAGTGNATVGLWHLGVDGSRREIVWDTDDFPYLTRVSWTRGGAVFQVMSRDQTRAAIHRFDPDAGTVSVLAEQRDDAWIDLVPGLPALSPDGRLVTAVDAPDTKHLAVEGIPITASGMQLVAVIGVDEDGVLAAVSTEATTQQLVTDRLRRSDHGALSGGRGLRRRRRRRHRRSDRHGPDGGGRHGHDPRRRRGRRAAGHGRGESRVPP